MKGYLLLADNSDGVGGQVTRFLLTDLEPPLITKLLKFATSSVDPENLHILGRVVMSLEPVTRDWKPERIFDFVQPRRFNDDKDNRYWSLLSKREAITLLQEWQEDPRYTEVASTTGTNYFKNQVDLFDQKVDERKWLP